MKEVYSAKNESELAVLGSVLDAEDIPHFVHNEMFGSIIVGPQINNYNTKSIMVPGRNSALPLLQLRRRHAHPIVKSARRLPPHGLPHVRDRPKTR